MIKTIRKWFGDLEDARGVEILKRRKADHEEQELARKRYEDEAAAKKAKWEAKNELSRQRDACNLGTTHEAFDGTYEEYLQAEQQRMSSHYSNMAASQMAAMQGPYHVGLGYGAGGILGSIGL